MSNRRRHIHTRKSATRYVETVIQDVVRLNNTGSNNPRWRLFTDHGTYETKSDASIAYDVENITGEGGSKLPVQCMLVITAAGVNDIRSWSSV